MNNLESIVWWLSGASIVMFLVSLFAIPAAIVRLPVDYFTHEYRHRVPVPSGASRVLYFAWLVAKNIGGFVLVGLGVAMLVLPGQGILCILIGLSLMNFPGKYKLEQFIVTRPPVTRTIQWLRTRANQPPLLFDAQSGSKRQ